MNFNPVGFNQFAFCPLHVAWAYAERRKRPRIEAVGNGLM